MQVSQIPILKFLKTANSLVIPVYQRDYAWKVDNCKKLWQDLLDLQSSNRMSHFLGTLVTINSGVGNYLVIDGQQRLTTVSIFILALKTVIKNKSQPTEEESRLEKVLEGYLIDEESLSRNTRIKLKPNKSDNVYFQELFNEKYSLSLDSNIFLNFQYFVEVLTSQPDLVTIFESIKKLEIVSINLIQNQDDPQLIFESLNSTGVDLTDGDLIRNYILMDLEPHFQEKLYTDYWLKIENFSAGNTAEFVRNFLMFKLKLNVKQKDRDTYQKFVEYVKNNYPENRTKVLDEVLPVAKIYSSLINQQDYQNAEIAKALSRIYKMEFTVCFPYLMDVLYDYENQILNQETVLNIIKLVESYGFRKILVDKTTQGLNKLFLTLAKDIKSRENWQTDYYDILAFILLSKTANLRFPNNQDLITALETAEVYKFQSKNKNFLLDSLENYFSQIPADLENLSIEHILPQKLRAEEKQILGENWQENHKIYLHTIGNLTLVSKSNNSRLSNKGFIEKSSMDFETSRLRLNQSLQDKQKWGFQEILNRSKELGKEATKIWIYPETSYKLDFENEDQEAVYLLEEEIDFTGKKPKQISIKNKTFMVKYWRDILKIICDELYLHSPTEFNHIIKNSELQKYFALEGEQDKLRNPVAFNNNKYVDGNQSANSIISFSKKLCDLLNFDKSEVEVEVK